MAHNYSSFSYKVTNENIRKVLAKRSLVNNTVQVGMPFIKATSTVQSTEYLGDGNMGFTLGTHLDPDVKYEDIFAPKKNGPLLGYTYKDGANEKIYVDSSKVNVEGFFTPLERLQQFSDINQSTPLPPPGIISFKMGRNRNGLSISAELEIFVPSLLQLEYLNKVFLVPGCGMVVEWGQQFAQENESATKENGLTDQNIQQYMFPWYNRKKLEDILARLGRREITLVDILTNYVYPTQGQYMWVFGRVANIRTKGNEDGSFNVTVVIKGPSEDQWAYSVSQTAFPSSFRTANDVCIQGTNSVEKYLTDTTPGGYNLYNLLETVAGALNNPSTPAELVAWSSHFVKLNAGNMSGDEVARGQSGNINQVSFADSDNAYYFTWRFFVNVILNYVPPGNTIGGIKGLYKRANIPENTLQKINFIRPYDVYTTSGRKGILTELTTAKFINDPYENYVGANKWLRSYDIGTMIIVNDFAANEALKELEGDVEGGNPAETREIANLIIKNNNYTRNLSIVGDFLPSTDVDKAFLSSGVWLNHKAVVTSMVAANSILQGVSNLLGRMNNATRNYWALTLDPIEATGIKNDYAVVDQNFKENSDTAINKLIDEDVPKIYTFNKYLRNTPGGVVGSELIDYSVDLDLPKLLFSQIATLGISRPEDENEAKPTTTTFNVCNEANLSDPNENLRKMFGITTIGKAGDTKSMDVTNRQTFPALSSTCEGVASPPIAAGVGGSGQVEAPPAIPAAGPDYEAKRNALLAVQAQIDDENNFCKQCVQCFDGRSILPPEPNKPPPPTDLKLIQPEIPRNRKSAFYDEEIGKPPTWRLRPQLLPITRYLTFNEAYDTLVALGCNTNMSLSIMATMAQEQPWTDSAGNLLGFKAPNYNFGGYDLGNGNWEWQPDYMDGWHTAREGTTKLLKPFIAFKSATFSLYRKAVNFSQQSREITVGNKKISFAQAELLSASEFAQLWFKVWNGGGAAKPVSEGGGGLTQQQALAAAAGRWNRVYSRLQSRIGSEGVKPITNLKDPIAQEVVITYRPPTPTTTKEQRYGSGSFDGPQKPDSECLSALQNVAKSIPVNDSRSAIKQAWDFVVGNEPPTPTENQKLEVARTICQEAETRCKRFGNEADQLARTVAAVAPTAQAIATGTGDAPNLNVFLKYLELKPDYMVAKIRCDSDGNKSNAFGAAPGTLSIKAELTLPGIAGIRVGELFWVDKLPAYYRIFGAFQVISIEDNVTLDGWTTKISASFNFLGAKWKNKMMALLPQEYISQRYAQLFDLISQVTPPNSD